MQTSLSPRLTLLLLLLLLLLPPPILQSDADKLESQARELNGPDGLTPDANGNELQAALAQVAAANEAGKFAYNKFFAVGLFRCVST
jgi:hypothetical protein